MPAMIVVGGEVCATFLRVFVCSGDAEVQSKTVPFDARTVVHESLLRNDKGTSLAGGGVIGEGVGVEATGDTASRPGKRKRDGNSEQSAEERNRTMPVAAAIAAQSPPPVVAFGWKERRAEMMARRKQPSHVS